MPALTRRRSFDQPDCWHVFYGDVQVGSITRRAGVPVDVDQWGWDCGFYPVSHDGRRFDGTSATFEIARAEFEATWREYLPTCTQADFAEYRRQRAWTAWKYQMHDTSHKLPTAKTSGWAKCFCGAEITNRDVPAHIENAHMGPA
jgi:hypothetical protein